jgi:molybdopterin molybdotransferase
MLTTAAARKAILDAMPTYGKESVAVAASIGKVLRESVVAERDQPPFDRVMMDGVAISYADVENNTREFPIQAVQAAGDKQTSIEAGKAIEVMTGASLPIGADCIVPVERISVSNNNAMLEANYEAKQNQFIHPRGSDHTKGTELLRSGKRISPMDVAIINSCGLADVDTSKSPRIRVISTGNELVAAGKIVEPHQIRMSNGPAVIAMLQQHGYNDCEHDHVVDDLDLLREKIGGHLDNSDVLVLSGGVSMGKADYIPQVLGELGVEVVFHKISQRPGKPMWYGVGPKGQAVFALPGNPVSTLVCCRQYVITALNAASGECEHPPEFASLAQAFTFKPQLTCFLPVRLISSVGGQLLAMPVHTNTSGDFAALTGTDGYIELPLEEASFSAGTAAQLHRW